jgi:hypothetical protein
MRLRILLVLSAALLLSVGVAGAAASAGHARTTAAKKRQPSAAQLLCESFGGSYSTRVSASFFRPFFKKQGVVWVCNSYSGGSASSQALVQSCLSNDGGKATSTLDGPPGFATCWQHPPL